MAIGKLSPEEEKLVLKHRAKKDGSSVKPESKKAKKKAKPSKPTNNEAETEFETKESPDVEGSFEQEEVASDNIGEERSVEEVPEHEENLSPEDKEIHDSTEDMSDEEEIEQEENAEVGEEIVEEQAVTDEQDQEGLDEYVDPDGQNVENNFVTNNESRAEFIEESDDAEIQDSIEDISAEEAMIQEDADNDGIPDNMEPHGEINELTEDADRDGSVDHEEAMSSMEDDDDSLAAVFEGHLEEEGIEEGMPGEEMGEEEMLGEEDFAQEQEQAPMDNDAMKDKIADTLQVFQMHRDSIEGLVQQNPELHSGIINMLSSMIEMGNMLGFNQIGQEEGEIVGDGQIEEETFKGDSAGDGMDSPEMEMEGEEEEGKPPWVKR